MNAQHCIATGIRRKSLNDVYFAAYCFEKDQLILPNLFDFPVDCRHDSISAVIFYLRPIMLKNRA